MIGYAFCGSFCTHRTALDALRILVQKGHTLQPIMSETVYSTDTRFGTAKDLQDQVMRLTGREIIHTIVGAEPLGPTLPLDALVVTMGDEARLAGMKLVDDLRQHGIRADLDHAARSIKAQFKYANKLGVDKVIVIAPDELEKGVVKLREMYASQESEVAMDAIVRRIVDEYSNYKRNVK